jgi:hypothetical protein
MAAGDELYDPSTESDEWDSSELPDNANGEPSDGEVSERAEAGEENAMPGFEGPDDPGLFAKLQDAFANLMSKIQPPAQTSNRLVPDPEGERQQPGEDQESGDRQLAASNQPGNTPVPSADFERREPADIAPEDLAEADIPGGGQSIAGSSEGSKEIKMAEQLEAMGKLSEIIGQRAENLTGEMMVEISSGDQELETSYTDSNAAHRAAGGGIHRDEVPLELREYVRAYFEAVRRQPDPGQ